MVRINQTKNTPNFNGLYNNKHVLKGLEYISEHGASFALGTSLIGATVLRPLAISCTPKTDKENKKAFTNESISSAVSKFIVAQSVALPIENAIKKIDENPKQFLNENTIKNLPNREYKFLTQTIKLASNLISAVPKSILGVALIPIVGDFLTKNKTNKEKTDTALNKKNLNSNPVFSGFTKEPNFTGVANFVSDILNNEKAQKFAKKHSSCDTNIARNMSVATDILLSATSAISIYGNKKIKKEQKNPLILNKAISTGLSILGGCVADDLIQKGTKKTIDKFKELHKNSPKLSKYIEGINILRPTLVFAGIYYGVIPIVSAFVSDKLTKAKNENQ